MDIERSETVGEVVTPQESGADTASAVEAEEEGWSAAREEQGGQSHQDNRRFQAARVGGERTGYDRARREIDRRIARAEVRDPESGEAVRSIEELEAWGREQKNRETEREQRRSFIARDAEEFIRRFPEVSLRELDGDATFRRFCGSRYGREPLAELYEDYRALAESAGRLAVSRAESKGGRATGSGGGSAASGGLSPREQRALEEWNKAYPQMKMTAKEFQSRG